MNNFVAIDFETANYNRSSICSVGLVVIRKRKIVDKIYHLIRPEPEWYWWRFTEIHGLTAADTENEKLFPQVWKKIEPKIAGLPLVAHNSSFEKSCLQAVFDAYEMDYPDYDFRCTLAASRQKFGNILCNHRLPTVAAHCGYELEEHHNALADAEACAVIAMKIL